MTDVLAAGVIHLADNDFGDNLGDGVAGPVGLLIIVVLAIATALLVRNMNKRLKRLPESFPDPRVAARDLARAEAEANAGPSAEKID
jgi:hypothetical protein